MRSSSRSKAQLRLAPSILAVPAVAWIGVFFFLPLLIIAVLSFGYRPATGGFELGFSFGNYARVADPVFVPILARTVRLAILNTLVCLALGLPLAWYLAFDVTGPKKALLVIALIVPMWVTLLVRIYAYFAILRPSGILPTVLRWLSNSDQQPVLLFTECSTLLGLVSAYMPLMVLPLFVGLQKLHRSNLLQVSYDLGAGSWTTFWCVALPLMRPSIFAGVALVFIPSLGSFIIPTLLGGGKSQLIGNVIADQLLMARDYPAASAFAVVLMLFVAVPLYVAVRRSREGLYS